MKWNDCGLLFCDATCCVMPVSLVQPFSDSHVVCFHSLSYRATEHTIALILALSLREGKGTLFDAILLIIPNSERKIKASDRQTGKFALEKKPSAVIIGAKYKTSHSPFLLSSYGLQTIDEPQKLYLYFHILLSPGPLLWLYRISLEETAIARLRFFERRGGDLWPIVRAFRKAGDGKTSVESDQSSWISIGKNCSCMISPMFVEWDNTLGHVGRELPCFPAVPGNLL